MNAVMWLKRIDRLLGPALIKLFPPSLVDIPVQKSTPSSCLIIRPGGIGDALLLAPMVRVFKTHFPNVTVDFLVEERNRSVVAMYGPGGQIYCYERPADFIAVLRRRYDVVIDTEQWYRLSAVVARLIRAQTRVGFATNDRSKLFSHPVAYSQNDYESTSFLRLLVPFDISPAKAEDSTIPLLLIPSAAKSYAATLLAGLDPALTVMIFPGASVAEKRWGAENFRRLAEILVRRGLSVVVVGGKEDTAGGAQIVAGGLGLNLAGKTSLVETAAIIEKSTMVISGDSGVLHLASGLGRPTVSLFGPSSVYKWAPRGPAHVVIQHKLPCSPCSSFGHMAKCRDNGRCLQEITVEEVTTAVSDLLQRVREGKIP